MMANKEQLLDSLLKNPEDEQVEFKDKHSVNDKDLADYCAGIANAGGGYLIFGVNDDREIVGTKIFEGSHQKKAQDIYHKNHQHVKFEEIYTEGGKRIVMARIPFRGKGSVIQSGGKKTNPIRRGESLVEMTPDEMREILSEREEDFSRERLPKRKFSIDDLEEEACDNLRYLLYRQGKEELSNKDLSTLLENLELLVEGELTYAALILLGKSSKLGELLSGAEIMYEWRSIPEQTHHDARKEWRQPFLKIFEDIWDSINARNRRFPIQQGLIQENIWAFNELVVREAILNAVTHRDYRIETQSIHIEATSAYIKIVSPGGLLPGITVDNILNKAKWRNRLLAEVLQKIGLLERMGEGVDRIYEYTIKAGKGSPSYDGTDEHQVVLTIPSDIKDKNFVLFLERVVNQQQISLSLSEILELERIRTQENVEHSQFEKKFLELGLIEKIEKKEIILSRQFYEYQGNREKYTALKGLPREKKKELILQHLRHHEEGTNREIQNLFPELSPKHISNLLQDLKREGKIIRSGAKKKGKWILKK